MKDRFARVFFSILLILGMPLAVFSQDPAAVLDLQSQIDQQAEQIAELQNLLDGKVDNGTSKNDVKLSGRIHADYWGFPNHDSVIEGLEGGDPQDRIGFRRIRFGVAGNIAPNMNYKIEMEFAGGNDAEFRDVYLGWRDLPVLGTLLLGNQKRAYGLDHINSSRYNVFVERPLVIESFNQDCRRFGLVSYNVTEDQVYNWRCGFYNKELMQNDGQAIGDHVQLEFAGRLAKTYRYEDEGRDYGHWAVSASAGAVDGGSNETRFRHRAEARSVNRWLNTGTVPDADHYELLGLEYARNKGPWQFVAEVLNLWMTTDADETVNYNGGYVYASFFLTGEHMPWKRSSGQLDRVKPLSEFLPTADGDAEAGMGAWQLAVRWINDQRRASVQGHHGLTAVQSELSKVVMHIWDRTRLGLRGFPHGPTGGDSCQLFRRIERLGDIIRTLQPSIGLVCPEALKIRLAVGIARGPVGLLIS